MAEKSWDDRDESRREGWELLDGDAFADAQETAAQASLAERMKANRRAMERSALELSGELGYERMTIAGLVERSASNRDRFYSAYGSKAGCYSVAYAAAIEQLSERLLGAGAAAPDWPVGFRRALQEVGRFIDSEPRLARGIFAEVYVADGAALAKRKEVFGRLTRAVDRARRESADPRHPAPAITPAFILGCVEAAILKTLREDGGEFGELVPALVYTSVSFYFDTEVAGAQLRKAGRNH